MEYYKLNIVAKCHEPLSCNLDIFAIQTKKGKANNESAGIVQDGFFVYGIKY